MNRQPHEMADLLEAMASMKQAWIAGHNSGCDARPEWVITLAKRDLSFLRQAAQEYRERALAA